MREYLNNHNAGQIYIASMVAYIKTIGVDRCDSYHLHPFGCKYLFPVHALLVRFACSIEPCMDQRLIRDSRILMMSRVFVN